MESRGRWPSKGPERAQRAEGTRWKEPRAGRRRSGGLQAAGRAGAESMCPGGKNNPGLYRSQNSRREDPVRPGVKCDLGERLGHCVLSSPCGGLLWGEGDHPGRRKAEP